MGRCGRCFTFGFGSIYHGRRFFENRSCPVQHQYCHSFSGAKDWGQGKFGSEHTSFAVPVSSGVVVEDFGVVADAEGNEAYHKGIDIQVPADSEILAAADGVVADISKHEDETYWITLKHEKHWSTIYGRLGETTLAVGDEVKKGDVLGRPAGEILHFEVLEDEIEKDPVRYFNSGTEESIFSK